MSRTLVMNPPEEMVAALPATMPMQGQFIWKPAKMTEAQKRQAKREQKRAQEIDYVLKEEISKEIERQQDEIKKGIAEQKPYDFKMKTKISPDDIDKTLYLMDRLQKVKKSSKRRKKKKNPIGMELMLPNPPKKKGTSVVAKGPKASVDKPTKRRKKRRTRRNPPLGVASLLLGGGAAVGVDLFGRLVAKLLLRKKLLESVIAGPATKGKVITYYGGWAAVKITAEAIIYGGLWMGTKNLAERNAVLLGAAIPPLVDLFAAGINILTNLNKPEEVQKAAKAELLALTKQRQPQQQQPQQQPALQPPAPQQQLPAPKTDQGTAPSGGSGTGAGTTRGSGGTEPLKAAPVEQPKALTQVVPPEATTTTATIKPVSAGSRTSGPELIPEFEPTRAARRYTASNSDDEAVGDDDELYGDDELSEEELSEEELSDDDELYGDDELSEEELSEEELSGDEELSEEELSEEEFSGDDQEELELLSGLSDEELAEIEAAEGLDRGYLSPLQAFRVSKRIHPNKSFVTQEV